MRIREGFLLLVPGAGAECHRGLEHWKLVFCNLCFHLLLNPLSERPLH